MAHQHTIIVAVNNAAASMEAVAVACTTARQRKSKIFAVHVIEVPRTLPLNAGLEAEARRGDQVLRKAEAAAGAAGHSVLGELLQARDAGQAIVDEARDRTADIVVLGVARQEVVGEFRLGPTAAYVLKHADCDVWLVRQGMTKPHSHDEEGESR